MITIAIIDVVLTTFLTTFILELSVWQFSPEYKYRPNYEKLEYRLKKSQEILHSQ